MTDPNTFDRVTPVDPNAWQASWDTEDNYWHENFTSRPYGIGPDYYERFRPAYRYGFESAQHHLGRGWDEAEPDLQQGWTSYQHRGGADSTWDDIKAAVRDAWDRVVSNRGSATDRRESEPRE